MPVFERGRSWVVKVELPRKADGSRNYYWKSWPTEAEARQDEHRVLAELAERRFVNAERMTVLEYLRRFIQMRQARGEVSASTSYHHLLWLPKRFAPFDLAGVRLCDLEPEHIEQWHLDLIEAGYARTTIQVTHQLLSAALNQAVERKRLYQNVAALVQPPKAIRQRKIVVWSPADAQAFLDVADREPDGLLWRMLLSTAIRIGEGLALSWDDVDFEGPRLYIRRSRTVNERGAAVIGTTKTPESQRYLMIPPGLAARLREHRISQHQLRLAAGPAWEHHNLIFPTPTGRLKSYTVARKQFHRIREAAGIAYCTPHALRHTAATMLLARGVPAKIVSEILGHRSIQTTLDLYAHVTDEMQRDGLAELERLIG